MTYRLLVYVLSLIIAFAPAYTFASVGSAALGGWSVGSVTSSMGQATINASKQIGGQIVRSYAQVAPTAGALARNIVRVGGAAAVLIAIPQLLGAGVDYVLDPANNRVKYYDPQDVKDPLWQYETGGLLYDSPSAACNAAIPRMQNSYGTGLTFLSFQPPNVCFYKQKNASEDRVVNGQVQRVARTQPVENKEKYLPYDAVGAQIAKNAAAGDAAANDFVADTANPNNWDQSGSNGYPLGLPTIANQLDANAGADAPPKTDNPPNTENPPVDPTKPFQLPAFCSWAAFVCNALGIQNQKTEVLINTTNQTNTKIDQTNTTLSTMSGAVANNTTAVQEMKGEVVNNGKKTDELKGAVVNAASAAHADSTDLKDEVKNGNKSIVDSIKETATNTKDVINTGIDKIVNNAKEISTATKDVINTAIDKIINAISGLKDSITGVKDAADKTTTAVQENTKAVDKAAADARTDSKTATDATTAAKDAVKENTAEVTKAKDQAAADAKAQKEATDKTTEEQKKTNEKIDKVLEDTPINDNPSLDQTPLSVPDTDVDYIRWNKQCPADVQIPISLQGASSTLTFSWSPWCTLLSKLYYPIIACAYISAAYIVVGSGKP